MRRLSDRVVVVTGAGGGLGQAAALALSAEGARLALTDTNGTTLAETAHRVRDAGGECVTFVGDVRAEATHTAVRDLALGAYARIDGLCNVAGILAPGTLEEVDAEQFDRVMQINCLAHLLAIQATSDALRRSGRGAIVNVASVGAVVGLPRMSLYCASKAAVLGLTRAAAAELAPHVRCNALCPGGIDTPMSRSLLDSVPAEARGDLLSRLTGRQMLPRFATAEEIASTVVFLVSDDSAFLTGAVLMADGGHTAW